MKKFYFFISIFLLGISILNAQSIATKNVSNTLDFDGIDDYISIPTGTGIIANLEAFSMCGWVYPTNTNAVWPDFDGYFGIKNEGVCDFYVVQINGVTLEVRLTTNLGQFTIPGSELSQIIPNVWQHFAVVYTGSELQLFYNGILDGSVAASGTILFDNLEVTIGKLEFFETDFYLDGKVDEVTFWDKALTVDEVLEIQCISGDPSTVPNLIAYYNFNETEGLILPEYFENYDGTLTNMTGTEWIESEICQSGYDILFEVTDELTGNPVEDASINVSGNIKLTDENGEATFTNYDPGNYPYTIAKTEYYETSGEVIVIDDDVIAQIDLAPMVYYDITYIITESPGGTHVDSAIVNMDGIIQYTDETGQTTFTGFLLGTYPYTVLKDGYLIVQGNAMVIDDDLTIEIDLLINDLNEAKVPANWELVSASNRKIIFRTDSKVTVETRFTIYDLFGKKVFSESIYQRQKTSLDLSSVSSGIYLITIDSGNNFDTYKVIIR